MTETIQDDLRVEGKLEVIGNQDTTQITIQGNTQQTSPLHQWQDATATPLARIGEDGRLQIGSFESGALATDDAHIEVYRDEMDIAKPKRGFHVMGAIADALSSVISWSVHELVLKGTSGIQALHTTLRVRLNNQNTGTANTGSDLRAGDFEITNDGGGSEVGEQVETITGIRVAVTNQSNGHVETSYGLKIEVNDAGSGGISQPYAIHHTGKGITHLEDALELQAPAQTPDTPASDIVRIYTTDGKLYAKTSDSKEYQLTLIETGQQAALHTHQDTNNGGQLDASNVFDAGTVPLVRGGTNTDLSATGPGYLAQASVGANIAPIKANFAATAAPTVNDDSGDGYTVGSLWLDTTNDNIYMCIDSSVGAAIWAHLNYTAASSPWNESNGEIFLETPGNVVTVGNSGDTLGKFTVRGIVDEPQMVVRGHSTQTNSLLLVQNNTPSTLVSVDNAGKLYVLGETEIDGTLNHDGTTIGFRGASPTGMPSATADIKDSLQAIGLLAATDSATPLNLNGGLLTARAVTFDTFANDTALGKLYRDGDGNLAINRLGPNTNLTPFYQKNVISTAFAVQTANTTINTTSHVQISFGVGSLTIPDDFLTQGKTLRLTLGGYATANAAADRLRLKLDFGSTEIFDVRSQPFGTTNTFPFEWSVLITCRSVGSSGTVFPWVQFNGDNGQVSAADQLTAAITINTTNAMPITVHSRWQGSAGAAVYTVGVFEWMW